MISGSLNLEIMKNLLDFYNQVHNDRKEKGIYCPSFLAEIKEHIYRSRLEALKSVNRELINLY